MLADSYKNSLSELVEMAATYSLLRDYARTHPLESEAMFEKAQELSKGDGKLQSDILFQAVKTINPRAYERLKRKLSRVLLPKNILDVVVSLTY